GEFQRKLLFAPASEGGRGVKSSEAAVYKSWLAAQALCAPTLKRVFEGEAKDSRHRQALKSAIEEARGQLGAELGGLLPVDEDTFVEHYAERKNRKEARELAESFTEALHRVQSKELDDLAKHSDGKRALLACLRETGARLVTTTIPQGPQHRQSNEAMSYLHREGLDLSPQPNMPIHCHCGLPNGQYASDRLHGLNCQTERGGSVTDRHDEVKLVTAHWMGQLGIKAKVEQRPPRGPDGRRPTQKHGDILVDTAAQTY